MKKVPQRPPEDPQEVIDGDGAEIIVILLIIAAVAAVNYLMS